MKVGDQSLHQQSLISVFVIHFLKYTIIAQLISSKIQVGSVIDLFFPNVNFVGQENNLNFRLIFFVYLDP